MPPAHQVSLVNSSSETLADTVLNDLTSATDETTTNNVQSNKAGTTKYVHKDLSPRLPAGI